MDDDYGHYKTYAYLQYRSPDQTSVPPLLAPRASTEEPATSKAAQDEVSYGFGASSTCQESDQGNDAQGFNTLPTDGEAGGPSAMDRARECVAGMRHTVEAMRNSDASEEQQARTARLQQHIQAVNDYISPFLFDRSNPGPRSSSPLPEPVVQSVEAAVTRADQPFPDSRIHNGSWYPGHSMSDAMSLPEHYAAMSSVDCNDVQTKSTVQARDPSTQEDRWDTLVSASTQLSNTCATKANTMNHHDVPQLTTEENLLSGFGSYDSVTAPSEYLTCPVCRSAFRHRSGLRYEDLVWS